MGHTSTTSGSRPVTSGCSDCSANSKSQGRMGPIWPLGRTGDASTCSCSATGGSIPSSPPPGATCLRSWTIGTRSDAPWSSPNPCSKTGPRRSRAPPWPPPRQACAEVRAPRRSKQLLVQGDPKRARERYIVWAGVTLSASGHDNTNDRMRLITAILTGSKRSSHTPGWRTRASLSRTRDRYTACMLPGVGVET